ncbi:glycosyltransferase family 2 protein [Shewanella dokdonensis]|uniref:Glycosyltransferase n=1 Tax=Shewanella dokdonensis TaxID=712036 RepID=A0ABX8DIB1_9GAMM|nr:glycosyltransferase family 2 protein [Shewanella dokdonensis]MCL1073887.1 glycosyltransferase [Shewanella dokdonensis]QVK23667.1 glycosyltransferase [Shewanella dokdonensis]
MKISIVTATWNSESTIMDTLDSLASQTYHLTEFIIVDGASKDKTLSLIQGRDGLINTVISEPDKGIYDALNKGIQKATGDVIGFLHSDDIFASPTTLEQIASVFADESIDALYGDLDYVSKDNTSNIIRHWQSGDFVKSKIKNGWMPPHPTFYMRRKHYLKLGGFDLSYRIAADYESILRYLWQTDMNVAYIPSVLVKMRIGGESNRSLKNIIRKSKEDWRAMKGNGVSPLQAILGKNLSKIPQFFIK